MVEGDELRAVMGRFPAGVAVVTVDLDGQRLGLTVASLVSLSLSPPLIGVAIRRDAALHELMHEAGEFAVSMLAEGQEHLAQHFARGVPPIALWEGIPLREAEGPPQLDGALGVAALPARRRARDRRPHVLHRRGRERGARPRRAATRLSRAELPRAVIEAVIFDLDGVLLDSEQVWDEAREQLANERGGRWHENAQRDMMGMSSLEWSRYMHETIGLPEPPEEISREVVERLAKLYRQHLPVLPGAREAVERLATRWPLGLASSSNRELIDLVLELMGVAHLFRATVSSEEVARGKPAPDVYLEAARRLGVDPTHAAAIEDSENGIRAAKAAGMRVLAIPNEHFPPAEEALAQADVVLRVAGGARPRGGRP